MNTAKTREPEAATPPKLFAVAPTVGDYLAFVTSMRLDPMRCWHCRTVEEALDSMRHNAANREPAAVVVLAGHTLGYAGGGARDMTDWGAKNAAGDGFPEGATAVGYVDRALAGVEPGPSTYIVEG